MTRSHRAAHRNPNRNKLLTLEERQKIDKHFYKEGQNRAQIARILKRSFGCINACVKNRTSYGTKKSPGRPRKLSKRVLMHVQRMASNLEYPLTRIQAFLRANNLAHVYISTLGRYVRKMENIERRIVEIILNLKPEEKEARVAWAEE